MIDDSVSVCRMICSVLEKAGYVPLAAHTGEEGLQKIARRRPGAILCDVVMPGMDGYELCRRVKSSRRLASVPVILLTSRADPSDKVKGLAIGANDYVTKPFDVGELLARVAAQIRLVTLQDELRQRNRQLDMASRQLAEKMAALSEAYNHLADLQEKRQKALDLAYKVQLGLLPSSNPDIRGFRFGSHFGPAEDIAGDFYDYVQLPGGRWGIAIGDVAGKGLPASLLMVLTKTLLRTEAAHGRRPSEVLESVNRHIIHHYGSTEAVTLFYGILDPADNSFTFSNGGHEFPLVFSPRHGCCTELSVGGTFLGIFPKARYNEGRIHLDQEDLVFFYTDGLYGLKLDGEAIDSEVMVQRFLQRNGAGGAASVIGMLGRASRQRTGADDVTLVAMSCGSPAASAELGYVRVHGDESSLKDVRDFAGVMARRLGLDEAGAYNLVYAVDEAAANAVHHAYSNSGSGLLETIYQLDPRREHLTVDIVDHGLGVPADVLARSETAPPDNALLPRGRGLMLMRSLMDRCDIIPTPGGGTTVRLTRSLGARTVPREPS